MRWLPKPEYSPAETLRGCTQADEGTWRVLVSLAQTQLSNLEILQVDRCLRRLFPDRPPAWLTAPGTRLKLLGTSTFDHLLPFLRVGALRHGLWLTTSTGDYGQCTLQAGDEGHDTVLLAHDARTLLAGLNAAASASEAEDEGERIAQRIVAAWRDAQAAGCGVIQQTILPVFPSVFGNAEHRLPGSRAAAVERLNLRLQTLADAEGVDLVAVHRHAAQEGLAAWHDPALWHRAKQEIHPGAAPLYGDLVARVIGARQGRSRKVLVLDLDNTLWGGVIGDDGIAGIVLGQGSAAGEAFVEFQHFVRDLSRRGVILAVSSKNEEASARRPFEAHPDMVLRLADIACFAANWTDKAANLRAISERLAIGLDAFVFVDDNPAERALVRRELPMVAVPELPDDPSGYPALLGDAGFFEATRLSDEDRHRSEQYQANRLRRSVEPASVTDMAGYLSSLDMLLHWGAVDAASLPRVVQLINKSNQFNLTTRRTTDAALAESLRNRRAVSLQLRLVDRFGNNGLIAVVLARHDGEGLRVTDWLMSCRVLKRGVEAATFNVLLAEARRVGARHLLGTFRPTGKNAMVSDHYRTLGFDLLATEEDGTTQWGMAVDAASLLPVPMRIEPPVLARLAVGFAA